MGKGCVAGVGLLWLPCYLPTHVTLKSKDAGLWWLCWAAADLRVAQRAPKEFVPSWAHSFLAGHRFCGDDWAQRMADSILVFHTGSGPSLASVLAFCFITKEEVRFGCT